MAIMITELKPSGKSQSFYGWTAMTGAALVAFVVGGSFVYSYGVFLPPMVAEFHWGRAEVALGLMIGMLAFGLPNPLTGILIARFGSRIIMVLGSLLSALGIAGMYFAGEVWHIYLFYGIAGLGAGIGGFLTCTTVATDWFVKKRSLALGIFTASAGLGGFVFPTLEAFFISTIGWRMAWIAMAGILFVGGSLIGGLILVRNKPEDLGQTPDGIPVVSFENKSNRGSLPKSVERSGDWRLGQALKNRAFWLIAAFSGANYFVLGVMIGHQVVYMQSLGFAPMIAALTLSVIPGVGIVGRLGFGILALRLDMKKLAVACFVMQLIGLVILITTQNLILIYIYSALFGISNGALMSGLPLFIGNYYGRSHFSEIQGIQYSLGMTALAIAPVIAGAIYDAVGTYKPIFIIVIAFSFVGLISVWFTRQPKLISTMDSLNDINSKFKSHRPPAGKAI